MTFFFDNMLPPALPQILSLLDVEACHLKDTFRRDTPDTEWLADVGERGWVVVTGDRHIKTRPLECALFKRHRVTAVFVAAGLLKKGKWEQARWIVNHWRELEHELAGSEPGTCFLASPRGGVKRL